MFEIILKGKLVQKKASLDIDRKDASSVHIYGLENQR
jgi:hypothetical protein